VHNFGLQRRSKRAFLGRKHELQPAKTAGKKEHREKHQRLRYPKLSPIPSLHCA